MRAAAYGLTKPEALRSITLSAAEILNIDEFVGSLDVGKDATFFISDKAPMEIVNEQQEKKDRALATKKKLVDALDRIKLPK